MSAIAKPESDEPATRPPGYPRRVPRFASEREEREFWDTHDSTYYLEGAEDVTHNPPAELKQGLEPEVEHPNVLRVHLTRELVAAVKEIAAQRGLSYQALLRSWIAERVEQERAIKPPTQRGDA